MKHPALPVHEFRWTPFRSLLRKEVKRFIRVIAQTLLIPLVNSTLYMLIFGVSLGDSIAVHGHTSYLAFLIPGIVMMAVLNNAFQNSSSSIGTSKFHGDLEDLKVAPLSPAQIVWAMAIAALFRAFLVGLITLSVGEIFHVLTTQQFLWFAHPVALIFFLVTGALSFAFMGIAIAYHAKNFDQLSAIGGFVLLPLMYLGGVFFPLTALHPFWQMLSQANPMLYFINGVRFGILGSADLSWPLTSAVALITTLLLYGIALRTVRHGSFSRW